MYVLLSKIIITKIVSGRWLKCEKNRRKEARKNIQVHDIARRVRSSNLRLRRKNCPRFRF
jgi:hypothetical protein